MEYAQKEFNGVKGVENCTEMVFSTSQLQLKKAADFKKTIRFSIRPKNSASKFLNEKQVSLTELAKKYGISYQALYGRIKRGWNLEKA